MIDQPGKTTARAAVIVYGAAFVVGAIVMSFEMLGSRYLNPYFGSGIYTWAALISTVLAALCIGYFLGGWLADRTPSMAVLGATVITGSAYVLLIPAVADHMLEFLLAGIDDVRNGSLVASFALLFFPVTLLGMYSPFAIRLLLNDPRHSGRVSGTVYGINTLGSIVGTLATTFYLIPLMGSRAITLSLGIGGIVAGLVLIAASRLSRRAPALMLAGAVAALSLTQHATAEALIDPAPREEMLKRTDGQIDHIETSYNDIFISKEGDELSMAFQLKGWDFTQSTINLKKPDELSLSYTRQMTLAVAYPEEVRRILMIGLGGGAIPPYLGRHMADVNIDTVEIDAGVITAAKKYFGIMESARIRYLDGDGRVFLNRNKQPYDLILLDAYHGGYIPFHLLTREFFRLVKKHLTPNGAVAVNVHDGTKLFVSTIVTMQAEFAGLHLYPTGDGEVIAVGMMQPRDDKDALLKRAAEMQEKFKFLYPLPKLMESRADNVDVSKGVLLTDDFAPADLYNALRDTRRRKKQ